MLSCWSGFERCAAARARVWAAGARPPSMTLDIDATLLTAHRTKTRVAGTYKHGYGFPVVLLSG